MTRPVVTFSRTPPCATKTERAPSCLPMDFPLAGPWPWLPMVHRTTTTQPRRYVRDSQHCMFSLVLWLVEACNCDAQKNSHALPTQAYIRNEHINFPSILPRNHLAGDTVDKAWSRCSCSCAPRAKRVRWRVRLVRIIIVWCSCSCCLRRVFFVWWRWCIKVSLVSPSFSVLYHFFCSITHTHTNVFVSRLCTR